MKWHRGAKRFVGCQLSSLFRNLLENLLFWKKSDPEVDVGAPFCLFEVDFVFPYLMFVLCLKFVSWIEICFSEVVFPFVFWKVVRLRCFLFILNWSRDIYVVRSSWSLVVLASIVKQMPFRHLFYSSWCSIVVGNLIFIFTHFIITTTLRV